MNENVRALLVIIFGILVSLLFFFEKPYRHYKMLESIRAVRHSDVAGGGDPSVGLEKNNKKK